MTTFKRLIRSKELDDAGLSNTLLSYTESLYEKIIGRWNFYNRAITMLRYRITRGSLGPDIAISCYYCSFEVVSSSSTDVVSNNNVQYCCFPVVWKCKWRYKAQDVRA